MDNHQTLTDSLLGPQDREPSSCQTPGPVTTQPSETAFSTHKSDSFPCLQPLSLHQQTQGEEHESGEVVVVVKQKTANGSSVIFLVEGWVILNAIVGGFYFLFFIHFNLVSTVGSVMILVTTKILCKCAIILKCLPPQ